MSRHVHIASAYSRCEICGEVGFYNADSIAKAETLVWGTDLPLPVNLSQERQARRDRVSSVLCKKGRVCSGTPPCPCWTIEVKEKGAAKAAPEPIPYTDIEPPTGIFE